MYTSDDQKRPRTALHWLIAAASCAAVSILYAQFSHGVSSGFMSFMCLFPLLMGALPFGAVRLLGAREPSPAARWLWNFGVVTLTVGSCMRGVFDIYGGTSTLLPVYWWVGGALAVTGAVLYVLDISARRRRAARAPY